jgi:hypothetical protein
MRDNGVRSAVIRSLAHNDSHLICAGNISARFIGARTPETITYTVLDTSYVSPSLSSCLLPNQCVSFVEDCEFALNPLLRASCQQTSSGKYVVSD